MWSPTHVQVVVQRAKGLITKGKHKTNDCFVIIALGKEKFQTSVKEKADENVEWHEECELQIPEQGNTAEIVLTALHRNFLGDEFLGTVRIPLSSFDVYEMPKNRWYTLTSKPGKENTKDRGKLEVRVGFIVRADSASELTKKEKHKRSLGQISSAAHSIGGSLLSIGSLEKRKGLKKLAKSIGSKVKGKSKSKTQLDDTFLEEKDEFTSRRRPLGQRRDDADPGVISDEDEFTFDDLSHKSSTSSLNSSTAVTNWKNTENLVNHSQKNQDLPNLSSETTDSNNKTDSNQTQTNTGPSSPPSKPPRFTLNSNSPNTKNEKPQTNSEDEWGQKLYGIHSSTALKRWENKRNSPKIVEESKTDLENTLIEHTSPKSSPITKSRKDVFHDIPIPAQRQTPPPPQEKEISYFLSKNIKENKKEKKKDKHQKSSSERIIIGGEESRNENQNNQNNRLPRELIEQFNGKSREDLIELILQLQLDLADKKKRLHDMEDYIDGLLLRVIECSPRLLQNPFQVAQRRLSSPGNQ